jgi:hypothetical protein
MPTPDYCEAYEKLTRLYWELYDMEKDYKLDEQHPVGQARLAIRDALEDLEESNT